MGICILCFTEFNINQYSYIYTLPQNTRHIQWVHPILNISWTYGSCMFVSCQQNPLICWMHLSNTVVFIIVTSKLAQDGSAVFGTHFIHNPYFAYKMTGIGFNNKFHFYLCMKGSSQDWPCQETASWVPGFHWRKWIICTDQSEMSHVAHYTRLSWTSMTSYVQ